MRIGAFRKMAKFKIRAIAVDYFEEEIEASTKEEAEEKFFEKEDSGELETVETLFLEGDEGFEVIKEIIDNCEEDEQCDCCN